MAQIGETHRWLTDPAKEILNRAGEKLRNAAHAKERAMKEQVEAQATIDFAQRAIARADVYHPKVGSEYQCPLCWIEDGRNVSLRAVPSDTGDDLFECRECSGHYVKPE